MNLLWVIPVLTGVFLVRVGRYLIAEARLRRTVNIAYPEEF